MASSDLSNRFEARARLLVETQDSQAKRIAAATDQPPADSTDMASKPDQLVRAWNYTPPEHAQTPEQDFWAIHDQVLQQALSQVPPDAPPETIQAAHNQAETQALNTVYPYRAELAGIGTKVLEDQVKQSDRIARIVQGRTDEEDQSVPPPIGATGSSDSAVPAPSTAPGGGPS